MMSRVHAIGVDLFVGTEVPPTDYVPILLRRQRGKAKALACQGNLAFQNEDILEAVSDAIGSDHELYAHMKACDLEATTRPDYPKDARFRLVEVLLDFPSTKGLTEDAGVVPWEALRAVTHVLRASSMILRRIHLTYWLRIEQREAVLMKMMPLLRILFDPRYEGEMAEERSLLVNAFPLTRNEDDESEMEFVDDENEMDQSQRRSRVERHARAFTDLCQSLLLSGLYPTDEVKDALTNACLESYGLLMLVLSYRHWEWGEQVSRQVAIRSSPDVAGPDVGCFESLMCRFRSYAAFQVFPNLPPFLEKELLERTPNKFCSLKHNVQYLFGTPKLNSGRPLDDDGRLEQMLSMLLETVSDSAIDHKSAKDRSILFVKAICIVDMLWEGFTQTSRYPKRFGSSSFLGAVDKLGQRIQATLPSLDPHVALAFYDLISSRNQFRGHEPRLVRVILRARDLSLEMPRMFVRERTRVDPQTLDALRMWAVLRYLSMCSGEFVAERIRKRLEMVELNMGESYRELKHLRLISDWNEPDSAAPNEQPSSSSSSLFNRPLRCQSDDSEHYSALPLVVHNWFEANVPDWRLAQSARSLECVLFGWHLSQRNKSKRRVERRRETLLATLPFDVIRPLLADFCGIAAALRQRIQQQQL